ncbi:hypothetical protein [Burkholderia contaminans]|uniref:hypothetical protein n=1 Tax=Burkholderia contaminans TaxID=488447 RepID=UPI00158EAEA0|nr:hypothetical protein [Burkholderia contaminans]
MDKIQKMFEEARELHASLQQSDDKVSEFLKYLGDIEAKRYRLLAVVEALHVVMNEKMNSREGESQFEHVYWKAIEDSDDVFMLTTYAYEYYEEDIEKLEKIYLKEKIESDLSSNSTTHKIRKI